MHFVKSLLLGASLVAVSPAMAGDNVKVDGTRFTFEVPSGWNPGYKDLDNLFMIFFKDPKSGAVLEGVYVRGAQDAKFSLADFKKARVDQQNKAYEGKHHKVAKEGDTTMGGAKGNYILTTWKEGDKNMEKHTAQHLKDGHRYMVVMWGEKGKVDKKMFDHAVSSFALVPAK
ncbi:MAG: hypothetical protein HY082_08065 [Gammaproteobacteria bacterium]|nr:hypothetical protein [Gammaproteobacteria bacterium]